MGETNYSTLTKTNMLKQLSGGDLVSCEFKRKDAFDFYNTAKIIIATNSLPDTTDRTDGFYRRWLLIEFKNRFREGKDIIDEITEDEYENMARKCVRILKDLLSHGTFTGEGSVEERMQTYERLSNPVNTFLETSCVLKPDEYCPTWFLYQKYCDYQEKAGYRQLSEREFSTQLKSMGYEIDQKAYNFEMKKQFGYTEDDGKRSNWRTVYGIGFNTNAQTCTTMQSVADVVHVDNSLVKTPYRENLSETTTTTTTCTTQQNSMDVLSTDFADLEKFCNDWEYLNRRSIARQDSVSVAMEFAGKWKINDVEMVLNTVRKMKGIYEATT